MTKETKGFIPGKWYINRATLGAAMKVIESTQWPEGIWYTVHAKLFWKHTGPTISIDKRCVRYWEEIELDVPHELMLKHIALTYGLITE